MLITTSGVAYAGQTVDKFGFDQNKVRSSGSAVSMFWVDKDGNTLENYEALTIMQSKSETFSLVAHLANSPSDFNLTLDTYDNDFNKANDLSLEVLGSNNLGKDCYFRFSSGNNLEKCDIRLTAVESSAVGKERFVSYIDERSITNNNDKEIKVTPYNTGGQITGVGSSREPNVLTAIAVSANSKNDNESFIIKINNLKDVATVHLEYQIDDTAIAQFDATNIDRQTCEKTLNGQSEMECMINVTPLQVGNTKIKFVGKNYWTDAVGNKTDYEASQLTDIKVNVGSLYAGYDTGKVVRKGSTQDVSSKSIRSLAVDGQNHRLFAISGNGIYQQNDFSSQNINLTLESSIPNHGSMPQDAQTLSLTNKPDTLLIGTSAKRVLAFNRADNSYTVESIFRGSIISISTDTKLTNFNYFADSANNFAVRDDKNNWIFNSDNNVVKGLNNLQVTAYDNSAYVSAEILPSSFNANDGGSKLLHWQNGKLVSIYINGVDPFAKGTNLYIKTLFNNGENILFAGASNGGLYQFNTLTNQWIRLRVSGLNANHISDIAIDRNKNIYLASDDGVYRIKKNHPDVAKKLDLYSTASLGTLSTLVIDNNLQ